MVVDYIRGFIYPFVAKKNIVNFVLGAFVAILSFLFIPLFFMLGFVVKAAKNNLEDDEELPCWSENMTFSGLFGIYKDGVMFVAVFLMYILPGMVLGYVASLLGPGSQALMNQITTTGSAHLGLLPTVLATAGLVIFVLGLFLFPAAMVVYAAESNLLSALNYPRVIRETLDNLKSYAVTTIFYLPVIILGIVGTIALNVFGGLAILFYALMVGAYVYPRSFSG